MLVMIAASCCDFCLEDCLAWDGLRRQELEWILMMFAYVMAELERLSVDVD